MTGVERSAPAVVIADNGSTDGTADLVAATALTHPTVGRLEVPVGGKSRALNVAIRATPAERFAFVDDDVELDRDWLVAVDGFSPARTSAPPRARFALAPAAAADPLLVGRGRALAHDPALRLRTDGCRGTLADRCQHARRTTRLRARRALRRAPRSGRRRRLRGHRARRPVARGQASASATSRMRSCTTPSSPIASPPRTSGASTKRAVGAGSTTNSLSAAPRSASRFGSCPTSGVPGSASRRPRSAAAARRAGGRSPAGITTSAMLAAGRAPRLPGGVPTLADP